MLKSTFAEAAEEGIIERNPISTLKCPHYEKVKGRWFRIEEQKLIHARKTESRMADEIDFYLMVGCRANEAPNCKPDFDNCRVWVERDKIDGTSGYVKISQAYCKSDTYINKMECKDFTLSVPVLFDIIEALNVSCAEFFSDNYSNYQQDKEILDLLKTLPKDRKISFLDLMKNSK